MSHRSAASRAYYGAFHACRPLADRLPDPPNHKGGMHDRLIRAMMECPISATKRDVVMAIKKTGILMSQLRSIRTKADYKCDESFLQADAEEAINTACSTIAIVQTITFP
jgi:uncharacterized protein (UPF0332 family)